MARTIEHYENLALRWNKAAAYICAGSEYIDEPELVFARVRQQLLLAKELGRRLGAANAPVQSPSTDPGEKPPHPPTLEECESAFWLASYADDLVKQYIETGKAEAETFKSLCGAMVDLEGKTIGGIPFAHRAEEFYELKHTVA